MCSNYLSQWWVEFEFELTWDCLQLSFLMKCYYMKVKRMGIKEILRRIWLFSVNKIRTSESVSKQPSQLKHKLELNSAPWHIIATKSITCSINIPSTILILTPLDFQTFLCPWIMVIANIVVLLFGLLTHINQKMEM